MIGAKEKKKFPPVFWMVILFEFFERGSYYGMMSVLAVYFTDQLSFSKEGAGVILGVIQPILYFLPIVAGALADRFGYRRALTVAFSLLGTGYFLTSQATGYTTVFLALVVMALGAGTFKPIISGTIARSTNEDNSSVAFGIYYWTINLGAFLFPLILVPLLKNNFGWHWIFVASALGTGSMLIPTLFFFKEPARQEEKQPSESGEDGGQDGGKTDGLQGKDDGEEEGEEDGNKAGEDQRGLWKTLASAFEIIYSPLVLLFAWGRRAAAGKVVIALVLLGSFAAGLASYVHRSVQVIKVDSMRQEVQTSAGRKSILVTVRRDQTRGRAFLVQDAPDRALDASLVIYQPAMSQKQRKALTEALAAKLKADLPEDETASLLAGSRHIVTLEVSVGAANRPGASVSWPSKRVARLRVEAAGDKALDLAMAALGSQPRLAALTRQEIHKALETASQRGIGLLFVAMLLLFGTLILAIKDRLIGQGSRLVTALSVLGTLVGILWVIPGAGTFSRGVCTVLSVTLLSLWLMDTREAHRYSDHGKFLLLIVIYSGFWVLYFQMFGAVLWYVKAYVDASSLNHVVSQVSGLFGLTDWRFDVEHVTVINAGTIILLQLLVSRIVEKRAALPTMIAGISVATVGMALLALSPSIWIFMAGIMLFSIGEMTAHPKFISYVGLTAPKDKVAMYMGYVFLYGVIGSSVGSILGSNLYVHFVDHRDSPRTLWLLFSGIGVATIVGLALYGRITSRKPAH